MRSPVPASQESERAVTREEGLALAMRCGSMFLETSAKTRFNVQQCFVEATRKVGAWLLRSRLTSVGGPHLVH